MSHEDAGHYAAKHAPDTPLNPKIAEQVRQRTTDGKITCTDAHRIAQDLNVTPAEVGVMIDVLEVRVSKCQLGLFGYGPKKRIVQPAEHVAPEARTALAEAQQDGRISCLTCWNLAQQLGLSRIALAAACETVQLKIVDCQLGTF
jgi:hypothetical protein